MRALILLSTALAAAIAAFWWSQGDLSVPTGQGIESLPVHGAEEAGAATLTAVPGRPSASAGSRTVTGSAADSGSEAKEPVQGPFRYDLEVHVFAPQTAEQGDRVPLAGVPVSLRQREPGLAALASGFTDGHGVWRVSIPAHRVDWNDSGWGSLVAELKDFGYRRLTRLAVKRARGALQRQVMVLDAKWGHAFRVAVHVDLAQVDAAPVGFIRFRAAHWRNPGSGASRTLALSEFKPEKLEGECSIGKEVFQFQFASAPQSWPEAILVDGGAWGSAVLDLTQQRRAPSQGELMVVWLRGSGVLKGRVVDAQGQPIAHVTVTATAVHPHGAHEGTTRQRMKELALEGLGRVKGRAETDEDGTFEIRGLRDGDYSLVATAFIRVPEEPGEPRGPSGNGARRRILSKEVRGEGIYGAAAANPGLVIRALETGVTQSLDISSPSGPVPRPNGARPSSPGRSWRPDRSKLPRRPK